MDREESAKRFGTAAKRSSLAAAFVFLADPALAECGAVAMPPEQFDHPPLAEVHLEFRPYYAVDTACRAVLKIRVGGREEACAGYFAGSWLVFLPLVDEEISSVKQECLLRHEFAHLNGWLPTHPDARFN